MYLSLTKYFNVNIDTVKDLKIARENYYRLR